MADLELVIKISSYDKEWITNGYHIPEEINTKISEAIANGISLPEGHGRIVDVGKIDEDRIESDNPIIYLTINGEYIEAVSLDYLNKLSTIIEADTESEDRE